MAHWIDENTYQFDSTEELICSLGLDPETIEGDYAEAFQHQHHFWNKVDIDKRFTDIEEGYFL